MKTVHRMPLIAAAVAVVALAGCSSGGGSATATGSGTSSAAAAAPVTLTFQSLSDQPATIAATKKIVDSWNAANPDIQVNVVQASWDSVNDKLTTQFAGGTAPDIIHDDAASIVSFAADGYLADLTGQMSQAKKDDIGKGLLASVTVDGKVVAYPTEVQSYMVFANKTLLDQAGVTIPTGDSMTWDQFRQIAKATTKNGVAGVGWGLKSPVATFMTLGLGSGGTYFDGTGTKATIHVGDNELALPKLVHQMAYDDKSILPVTLTQSGSEALAAFYGGKVAMTVQGSYLAASMAKDAPSGFSWVVLPPLAGPQGAAQAADPQTLSVSADSKHAAQAVKFLEYFTSSDNLEAVNEADALIPATTSAQKAMATKLGSQNGWDQILKSGKDFQSAPFLFVNKYSQWKSTVATPAFQKYLANQIDDAGLTDALTNGWKQLG
ncbi:Putative ABC transporter substrate-binding protein YesO [Cellulomonas sp. T2.31MG-18]